MLDQTSKPLTAATLLTADDLAARWQVPKSHVYRLAREGRLPTVELGRYRRFTIAAVESFEAGGGTQTASQAERGRP